MKIELELNVPERHEPTGEYRTPKAGERYLDYGRVSICCTKSFPDERIILKRVYEPAPWLPDGCWLYYTAGSWLVSRDEPDYRYYHCRSVSATDLAYLHGDTFKPPDATYQVRRA